MTDLPPIYRPQKLHLIPPHQSDQDHLWDSGEGLARAFEKRYGLWRPYLKEVRVRHLECRGLDDAFARIRWYEYVTERALESPATEHTCARHTTRNALWSSASRCWPICCPCTLPPVRALHTEDPPPSVPAGSKTPGRPGPMRSDGPKERHPGRPNRGGPAARSHRVHTALRGFPGRFNPHLHILAKDGAFYDNGVFRVASRSPRKALERLSRHKVLRMLLDKGRITPETIEIMDRWRHSRFNVYSSPRILPREKSSGNCGEPSDGARGWRS